MKNKVRPPFWYQGLFLQPHHFQYQELFLQSQIDTLRSSCGPFLWGISSINFREGALDEQVVELLDAVLTFQDGISVSVPETAAIQSRSLKDIAKGIHPETPLKVYLALRRLMPNEKNAETVSTQTNLMDLRTRYISSTDTETVPNLYEGGEEAQVKFLKYSLKIIWEHELNDYGDYHCMPVALIEVAGDTLQYSPGFIPPLMNVAISNSLKHLLRDILDGLLSKSKLLDLYKITRPIRIEDLEGNYLRYIQVLQTINQFIPLLQHIKESKFSHPWTVYGTLRQLVGGLSTFTERINVLGKLPNGTELISPYNHEELEKCFDEMKLLIRELLNEIIVGDENIIELIREGSYFSGNLPVDAFDRRNNVCLMVRAAGAEEDLLNSLQRHAKVGPGDGMDILVTRALNGISFTYRSTSLPGIPVHPDGYLFLLDRSGPIWEKIAQTGSICMYWDEAPENTVAEIIISRR